MRITLFTPSSNNIFKGFKRSSKRQPMLAPAYLIPGLVQDGNEVTYIDGDAFDYIGKEAANQILKTNPDLVGFSITAAHISEVKQISAHMREAGWEGHITLGGVHPSIVPEETLGLIPEADSVVVGEGEETIRNLVMAIEKQSYETLGHVAYRKNGTIVKNGGPHFIADIDKLPLPAFDYYPMHKYNSPMWSDGEPKRMGTVATSRGCAFNCEFCAHGKEGWGSLRYHSVDRVVTEIKKQIDDFKIEFLVFCDDTFTVNKKRCEEICAQLKANGIKIPFMITGRVDTVTYDFLKVLRDSGCFLITYGIESGSNEVLKAIGKNTNTEKIRKAVKWAKHLDLKVVGNYMFGHWPDTEATCRETIDLALELDCDISQFSICIPYPGSALYKRAVAENRILPTHDYSNYGWYYNVPWIHPNLTEQQLINFQKSAYKAISK